MFICTTSSCLITFIMALLSMAFFTLLERKILGYIQTRKGPNKVSISGIPQPLADAAKLFLKEQSQPKMSNYTAFILSPAFSLFLSLSLWSLYPHSFTSYIIPISIVMFLCISSLNVYATLAAGWFSNSKYALLGSLRSIAQTISYEVSMTLILLSVLLSISSLSMSFMFFNQYFWPALMFPLLFMCWFTTTLAETNRTPFDFAEGESELVSGFNTEYSSGTFALLFMAEYASIIVMALFTVIFFTNNFEMFIMTNNYLSLKTLLISIFFLWIRGSFPRMRYDRLMSLTWKTFLLFALMNIIFISPLIIIFQ